MNRLVALAVFCVAPTVARAQGITLDDLQGITIVATNTYSGVFRNDLGTAPGGFDVKSEIRIGPGDAIKASSTRSIWVETPNGTKTGQLDRSMTGKIGTPQTAKNASGSILWVLEGKTLVRLRTFEEGGSLMKITLDKSAGGVLTCKVEAPLVREQGVGRVLDTAALPGGGKVEVLSIKPIRTSCSIKKP